MFHSEEWRDSGVSGGEVAGGAEIGKVSRKERGKRGESV